MKSEGALPNEPVLASGVALKVPPLRVADVSSARRRYDVRKVTDMNTERVD